MILSACVGVFDGSISTETISDILINNGYQGIELLGEPKKYDINKTKELLKSKSLSVTALTACSRLKTGRDLASKNKLTRQLTIDHYKECLYVASELSSPLVGITLTAVGRFSAEDDYYSETQRALDSVLELSRLAKKLNKILIIEPLNRYASFMMNTIKECKVFITSNNIGNTGICADLFHMNIEETSYTKPFVEAGNLLKNIHVSDSNRQGIGCGHVPFNKIYRILKKINYFGPLTLEAWSLTNNPYSNKNSSLETLNGYLVDFSKITKKLDTQYSKNG